MVKRLLSLVLVVIILFLGTFVWLIRQPFFQERLKVVITNYVTEVLKKSLKYKDVSFSAWGPALVASDVVLSTETEEVKLQKLTARISLFPLLRGRFQLASIKGFKVEISLKKNWEPPALGGTTKGISFKMPDILFEDFSLKYERPDGEASLSQASIYVSQSYRGIYVILKTPALSFSLDKYKRENVFVDAHFLFNPEHFVFDKFLIRERQNELNFNGKLFLSKKENFDIPFEGEVDIENFQDFLPELSLFKGHTLIKGRLQGSFKDPLIAAQSRFKPLYLGPEEFKEVAFSFLFQKSKLSISQFLSKGEISGRCDIYFGDDPKIEGSLVLKDFPLENISFLKNSEISGKAQGSLDFKGGLQKGNLILTTKLKVKDFKTPRHNFLKTPQFDLNSTVKINENDFFIEEFKMTQEKSILDASGNLSYKDSKLSVKGISIHVGDSVLRLLGHYDFRTSMFQGANIQLEKIYPHDLESFGMKLPLSFESALKGSASLNGKLGWQDSSFVTHLEGEQLKVFGESFERFNLDAYLNRGVFRISNLKFKKGDGEFRVEGYIDSGKQYHLSFKTENMTSESFDFLSKYPFLISAHAFLSGSIKGNMLEPEILADLKFSQTTLNGEPLPNSVYKMTLKKKKMDIDGRIFDEQARLLWTVDFNSENNPFEMKLTAENFNFKPLYGLLRGYVSEGVGLVTGQFEAKGFLKTLQINEASCRVQKFRFELPGYFLENEKKFELTYINHKLNITGVSLKGTKTALLFSGYKSENGELHFEGGGVFNLAFIPLFLKEIEYGKGDLNFKLAIKGNIDDPELSGEIEMSDGFIRSRSLHQTFENIKLRLFLQKNKILVDNVKFIIGQGEGSIGGAILFSQFLKPEFDLALRFKDFTINLFEGLKMKSTGHVVFKGKVPFNLEGNLELHEVKYTEYLDWRAHILNFDKKTAEASSQKSPFFNFDIKMKADKKVFIDNNLMKAELRGEVTLVGNENRPILLGQADVIKGEVYFRDNTYQVQSAHLSFRDKEKMNPFFRFVTTGKIKKYEITISGSGTLDQYQTQFQSTPPLSQTDIVSLMTLGILTTEIGGEEALGTTSFEAATFLFQEFQEKLTSQAKKRLGVDFRIAPSYSDTKNAVRPRIFLSKDLHEKLEVSFSSTLDKASIFEDKLLNLEWRLNRHMSFLGLWEDQGKNAQDTNSAFGVDVKFKYEFE